MQVKPLLQGAGAVGVHGVRHVPETQRRPVRQMRKGTVFVQAWPSSEISEAPQAHTPPPPTTPMHAGHPPGFVGLQGERQTPAAHVSPTWQGVLALQAAQSAAPLVGMHTNSVEPCRPTQLAGEPITGWQVVAVQPAHSPWPLQHARQYARSGSTSSMMHMPQALQTFETSQRSPVLPVGLQVPPVHVYPGAQSVATVAGVHCIVQAVAGWQNALPLDEVAQL